MRQCGLGSPGFCPAALLLWALPPFYSCKRRPANRLSADHPPVQTPIHAWHRGILEGMVRRKRNLGPAATVPWVPVGGSAREGQKK